jgi:serine/threonine protein kinase
LDWSESRPDEPEDPVEGTRLRARELTTADLLTAWQVEQVLAGEVRRLHLGPYLLLDWIGAGGMGSVYKAEHRLMKRIVALKVLGGAVGPGPKSPAPAVARFRREVEAAALLSHPNIVAAYDAIRIRGALVLVMEYVEGIDLGRLTQAGPLPIPLACEAIRQTALALQYAHERGLLHCDVKPANLLLVQPERTGGDAAASTEGTDGPPRIKLLDMGLARRMAEPSTADDDLDGTPDYMAPERGGGDPIDGRSDLYSLGCTFYHLLTGQPPFPGGDGAAKLLRHRIDAPPPVRDLRPEISTAVAAVVERLTARDAADRFATAAAVAEALENCPAVGRSLPERPKEPLPSAAPTPEEPPSPPAPFRPKPSKKRAALRLRLFVFVAIGAGLLVGAAIRWSIPSHPTAPTSSPSIPLPFVVEGRPGGFASLAEAVAAADGGAVVTIHGAGPYPTPPLAWRGRSLTLRAAPGDRPCLETTGKAADPWQALFTTDRNLTLEGLDLRSPPGQGGWLIHCERAALHLRDCRLSAPDGAGIVQRNGAELTLHDCGVDTSGTAVLVEVGDQASCKVCIIHTSLEVRDPSGAGLALWASEVRRPTAVDVELTDDTITAARATALTALPAAVHITARGDEFFFRDALMSCAGYADQDGWKRTTTWEGRENHYHAAGKWLNIEGVAASVQGIAGWRALWSDEEIASSEAP